MTCCAIRGATAVRTPPTKCAGGALCDEDATPCAPSVSSATRKLVPNGLGGSVGDNPSPSCCEKSPSFNQTTSRLTAGGAADPALGAPARSSSTSRRTTARGSARAPVCYCFSARKRRCRSRRGCRAHSHTSSQLPRGIRVVRSGARVGAGGIEEPRAGRVRVLRSARKRGVRDLR
jgi:hypothetical protein